MVVQDYKKLHFGKWTLLVCRKWETMEFSHLLDEGGGKSNSLIQAIPSSDSTRVQRFTLQQDGRQISFYSKEYLHRSWWDAAKSLVCFSRAHRAFRAGLMLKANGLNTPEIAMLGQKKIGPFHLRDILITRDVENACSLYPDLCRRWLSGSPVDLQEKRRMIRSLGQAVGSMHRAGIFHGDLRCGNILAETNSTGWHFYLIDNERTRQFKKLPFRYRKKNLVQLNMFQYEFTGTDRMRFYKAYIQAAGLDDDTAKQAAVRINEKTKQRLRKRAKGLLGFPDARDHREYKRSRWGSCRGIFLSTFSKRADTKVLLEQIEQLISTGTILKQDQATHVVRCRRNGWDFVIKRYNHQGLMHSLRHTLKGSRARKCWQFAHRLEQSGIATAKPLGFLEEYRFGLIWRSYILNAFVNGQNIKEYLNSGEITDVQKQEISRKIQHLFERFVRFQMTHGDPKPNNILIAEHDPIIIDLDSMKRHRFQWTLRFYQSRMQKSFDRRLQMIPRLFETSRSQ